MIITQLIDGLGNQLFRYAAGRRLAYKLNTKLKIDKSYYDTRNVHNGYELDQFNIEEDFVLPEDIKYIEQKEQERGSELGIEMNYAGEKGYFMPEVLEYPDDVFLRGHWQCEKYFIDIEDIIRKEFTLKNELGDMAAVWKKKIESIDNSVCLHIRHGDYVMNPNVLLVHGVLPLDYYYESIQILKKYIKNFKIFVFSDDLNWAKKNLKLDMPTEFVENVEKDTEELYLMSICKHNIIANSSFSWWGAWLNSNPDKKVFAPDPWFRMRWHNHDIIPDTWEKIAVDFDKPIDFDVKPFFSLILVVEDDIKTIKDSLTSISSQNYMFYEVIIIDNASIDGSDKFCQQAVSNKKNIIFTKLYDRVSKPVAWNLGLNITQGKYVMFLEGKDQIFFDALSKLYLINENKMADILNAVTWATKNSDKEIIVKIDAAFSNFQGNAKLNIDDIEKVKLLVNQGMNSFLGTKIFNREFLIKNDIKFNKKINNLETAELLFLIECFCNAQNHIVTSQIFYIESENKDI